MRNLLRTALFVLLWLVASPAFASTLVVDGQLIAKHDTRMIVLQSAMSGAVLAAGIGLLMAPNVKNKKGPSLLLIIGAVWLGAVLTTMPFKKITADNEGLVIRDGVLGKGIRIDIPMAGLEQIEVYQARRRKTYAPGKRKRYLATLAKLIRTDGESKVVEMSGDQRIAALDYFLECASEEGVVVVDRREDGAPPE